jgi:hypothetical protein
METSSATFLGSKRPRKRGGFRLQRSNASVKAKKRLPTLNLGYFQPNLPAAGVSLKTRILSQYVAYVLSVNPQIILISAQYINIIYVGAVLAYW